MSECSIEPHFENRKLAPEHAVLFATVAIFLTILAPFRTDIDLTIPFRFLYWFGAIFGGTAIALLVSNLFQRHTRPSTAYGFALATAAQVLAASIPITLLVGGLEMWLRDRVNWIDLPLIYPYVTSIVAVITVASLFIRQYQVLRNRLAGTQLRDQHQSPSKELPAGTRFHLRLDPHLRQEEITMLKAEDHYLRVCTGTGTAVIRCNLSAAIHELASVDGQRVHRSFWVARSAIQSVRRHGSAFQLVMKDGQQVPLSRRRYSELSNSSWLPI